MLRVRLSVSVWTFLSLQASQYMKFSNDEIMACADAITLEALSSYVRTLLKRAYVQCLMHGNIIVDEAKSLYDAVLQT